MIHPSLKGITLATLFIALIAGIALWLSAPAVSSDPHPPETYPLKVTFLKVGKADAIVLQQEDHTLIIDAGEEEDGAELLEFLKTQHISTVDTLIITHFDNDHVGGADTLVEALPVKQVLLPAYEGTTVEYTDFIRALDAQRITPQRLTESLSFNLGDATVLVEPPLSYEISPGLTEYDNNFSLITTVTHGENRLLFTGDAEKQRIREWLSSRDTDDCDLLKVPHHGVYNTALQALFEAVSPDFGIICSSHKNPADPETLSLLKQNHISPFQTKDGNITALSDGKRLEIRQDLEAER